WARFDTLLQSQKITPMFHRRVRSTVEHEKYYKAMESLIFLLFLSPLLVEVLSTPLFKHHMSLVSCLLALLDKRITVSKLNKIEATLYEYLFFFQVHYGDHNVTLNLHHLIHLVKIVRMHGPLWCYSCFHFEGYNHILLKGVHGSNQCHIQAARSMDMYRIIKQREKIVDDARYFEAKPRNYGSVKESMIKSDDCLKINEHVILWDKKNALEYRKASVRGAVVEAKASATNISFHNFYAQLRSGMFVIVDSIYVHTARSGTKSYRMNVWPIREGKKEEKIIREVDELDRSCIGLVMSDGKYFLTPVLESLKYML
ncbi:hypothetical protein AKO1_001937, partial [Acrasis kona]